jgi:type II secretory pathway component PulM
MSFATDLVGRFQERWDNWTPRERRMVALLGGTFALFVVGLVTRQIVAGLGDLEDKNERTRAALKLLSENREDLMAARSKAGAEMSIFDAQAPPLATYLEGIANELGIQIPESTERQGTAKGKFAERLVDVKLKNITLAELAEFMRRVEMGSPVVVTQRVLVMKSAFGTPEKIDSADLTIAAYERVRDTKKGEAKEAQP